MHRTTLAAVLAATTIGCATSPLQASAASAQPPTRNPEPRSQASSDVVAVEAVARDYIEGWYTGDVERMDRALHDDLVKRIPVSDAANADDPLRSVSKSRMLELTGQGGGEDPNAEVEIFVDDVSEDIATARVVSPEYLDYLHLAKTPDGWKIVNVLFRMRD